MKLIVERDSLVAALANVQRLARGATAIPILKCIRLTAKDNRLLLFAHNLDAWSEVSVASEVSIPGICAVPEDFFGKLVRGMPVGSQLSLSFAAPQLSISTSSATYKVPTFTESGMPKEFRPETETVVALDKDDVANLFARPAPLVCTEETRYYIAGTYLHEYQGMVASCSTNGHGLVRIKSKVVAPKDFAPVIVPPIAASEIVRMGDGELRLKWTVVCIAAENSTGVFVSKLIDATFPDYQKIIPPPTTEFVEFDRKELVHMLERMDLVESKVIEFEWEDEPNEVTAKAIFESGVERIACSSGGVVSGKLSVPAGQLINALSPFQNETVRILLPADRGLAPVSLVDPNDPDIIALQIVSSLTNETTKEAA